MDTSNLYDSHTESSRQIWLPTYLCTIWIYSKLISALWLLALLMHGECCVGEQSWQWMLLFKRRNRSLFGTYLQSDQKFHNTVDKCYDSVKALLFSKLLDWNARHSLIVCFNPRWIIQTCIFTLDFQKDGGFPSSHKNRFIFVLFCCTRPVSFGVSNISQGSFLSILIYPMNITNSVKGGKSTVFCLL